MAKTMTRLLQGGGQISFPILFLFSQSYLEKRFEHESFMRVLEEWHCAMFWPVIFAPTHPLYTASRLFTVLMACSCATPYPLDSTTSLLSQGKVRTWIRAKQAGKGSIPNKIEMTSMKAMKKLAGVDRVAGRGEMGMSLLAEAVYTLLNKVPRNPNLSLLCSYKSQSAIFHLLWHSKGHYESWVFTLQ